MTENDRLGPCSPFFIVSDLATSLAHYTTGLGFECRFTAPDTEPFFAIVSRDTAQIMLKVIGEETPPLPNPQRHEWANWDAFIWAPDPDALARELAGRNVKLHRPIDDTDDGLRGFEVADPDGYVCFFGRTI